MFYCPCNHQPRCTCDLRPGIFHRYFTLLSQQKHFLVLFSSKKYLNILRIIKLTREAKLNPTRIVLGAPRFGDGVLRMALRSHVPRKCLNYTASFWPRNNHILSLKSIELNIREVRAHVRERDGMGRQQGKK